MGGDTLFADQHAAYDALPEALKKTIAPLLQTNLLHKPGTDAEISDFCSLELWSYFSIIQ